MTKPFLFLTSLIPGPTNPTKKKLMCTCNRLLMTS